MSLLINICMLISEIITESPAMDSDVNAVWTAIASPIQQLYNTLDELADRMYNEGKIENFDFVSGNHKSRWVQQFVRGEARERGHAKQAGILTNLYALAQDHPEHSQKLQKLLQDWNNKFSQLESKMPMALMELGKGIGSDSLVNHARSWQQKARALNQKVADLKERQQAEEEEEEKNRTDPAARKQSGKDPEQKAMQRQQMQQAEQIMNAILSELPRKQRHEIRQAVARADQPLQALQAELSKRNISI